VSTALLLFFGRGGESDVEHRLDEIKIAIGASVLRRAQQAGFSPILAVTSDPPAVRAFSAAGADVVVPVTSPFHFGNEVRQLTKARGLERVCTIGAGAGALFTAAELRKLREEIETSEALVLSNNYYSADLVAFTPASTLDVIELPATDNPLPRRLHQQGGLSSRQLDRSAATLLDVDTPADAAVLKRHPACPAELRGLDAWEPELGQRIDALMRLVTTPEREMLVAGRVGAPVWSYLESQTACRVRMLAEERGMQAAGRDSSGAARTALGFLYGEVGPERFFAQLGELADGLLFDTRVLFAHMGWRASGPDRVASDLFRAGEITEGPLAAFTQAAAAAGYPLLLGGHTLVAGVLWTLVEAAWSGHPDA
jgi:CTP:molybdopterin cytidylyltransferase MocA